MFGFGLCEQFKSNREEVNLDQISSITLKLGQCADLSQQWESNYDARESAFILEIHSPC